jgi:alpha-1,2-mannosyltransferase
MRVRRTDLLALGVLALFVVPLAAATMLRDAPPVDLAVYLRAGRTFLTGGALYADGWGAALAHPLPYTYPPLWAALVAPLSWLHWRAASIVLLALNLVLLVWVVRLAYARFLATIDRSRLALAVLVVVMAVTTPIGSVFWFGQVGILLAAACLADVVPERTRLPRGLLVGFATAVKLTPGLFIVYWVVTKRWRAAITAAVTSAGLWLVSAAIRPDLSREFWSNVIFRTDRVGDPGFVSNQSLYGALVRAGWANRPVWAVVALAALAIGLLRARDAHLRGDELAAATIVGLTTLLISPVSWIDHAVWIVPASGILLADGRDPRRRVAWAGLVALFVLRIPDWVADGALPLGAALTTLLENAYLWAYVALVILLPTRDDERLPGYVSVGSSSPS